MATSGSFSTNQVKAGSRTWYWDFSWWVASWNGNTATINWNAYTRATSGTSGQSYVSNYGFSITVNGSTQTPGGNFYKDNQIASGSFTLGGGTSFSASITAHPYGGSYTSSGNSAWTLNNNIVKPSVKLSIASVSETTVTLTGTITSNGNGTITASGYKYKQQGGSSWLNCTNSLTNLTPNTTYYFKYYATNSAGTTETGADNSIYTTTWNKPTISNVAVKNLIAGNSQTVTLSNSHNRNCTIKVTKVDGGTVLYTGSTTGTSLTFTIPADKCRLALGSGSSENKTPVNLTYTCSYSSWSTPYNTSPSCTLGINTTYKPTWNSNFDINAAITYRDTNSTSRNITGNPQILVRGKSKWAYSLALKGTQAAIKNSNSESNIKKYRISFDNFSNYLEIDGSTVEKTDLKGGTTTQIVSEDDGANVTSSSLSISIQAIDCKGVASDIKTKTIPVTPYAVPTGTITAKRQNNYGTTVELTINPIWAVSSRNAGTAAWSYKLSTASSWTTGGTINQFNTPVALGVSFDNTLSYEFKVVLTDAFGGSSTAEIKTSVGPGMPIFFIDETVNGIGVNKIPTQQGAFIDGIIKGYDGINIDGQADLNDDTNIGGSLDVTGQITTSGTINSNKTTSTYLNGNKGINVVVNNTASKGFNILARQKSTNGVFMQGTYNTDYHVYYTTDTIINAGTNSVTHDIVLLNESGQTKVKSLYVNEKSLLDVTYPVGAIYLSAVATSPASLFGGTWVQLKSRYLYATSSTSGAQGKDNQSTYTGVGAQSAGAHVHGSSSMYAGIGITWDNQNIINQVTRGGPFNGYGRQMGGLPGYGTGNYSNDAGSAVYGNTDSNGAHTHNVSYVAMYVWQRTA